MAHKFVNRWFATVSVLTACLGWADSAAAATAYGLTTTNQLIAFDTATPGTIANTVAITGLQGGEQILAIDMRPATGQLFGLGSTSRLYRINPATGVATQVGTGTFSTPLSGTDFGFDFNPAVDRIRVVSDTEQNLRLNPNNGSIAGLDVLLNPAGNVVASAYTNSFAGTTTTTLYGIDSASDQLVLQGSINGTPNSPNGGAITPVGALGFNTSSLVGFDIAAGNQAFASLTAPAALSSGLYTINLTTGTASLIGTIGGGVTVRGLAVVSPVAVLMYGVTAANALITFNSAAPGTILTSTAITGLQTGESILGIDQRPATAQLYALGSTSRLYLLDPATAVATPIGPGPFSTALSGTEFGVDFNPVVDRVRIVSDAEQNMRVHPDTGLLVSVDTALSPAGSVVACAYTNNVPGAASTTLYGIDSASDQLVTIGGLSGTPSPNGGILTPVGALGVDASAVTGFDISVIDNTGFAALNVGGLSRLYTVNLSTGAATLVGTIGAGDAVRGLTVVLRGFLQFSPTTYFTSEGSANASVTVTRTGSLAGFVTVDLATSNGTATAGSDYTAATQTLAFPDGVASATFTFPVLEDFTDEPDETVIVTASNPQFGASLKGPLTATVNLVDNDGPDAPPSITIVTPTANPAFTAESAFLTLSGIAADDIGVSSVAWITNRGASGTASGTTNWIAANVPLVSGVNVITVRAIDTFGGSATDVLTVTVPDLLYSMAEGSTGGFFDTDILLANPSSIPVPISTRFLKEDGTSQTLTQTLPPTSRSTIPVDTVPGLEAAAVSTFVTSTLGVPIVVERTMRWDPTGYGAHTDKATAGAAPTWYFAEGSQGFFSTFVLLANPNGVSSTATVEFLREDGTTVSKSYTLAPTSRLTLFAGDIPELVNRSFGITVTFTQPGIAERAMYFGQPLFNGGHESAGVTDLATDWTLAEGATGSFFTTFLLLTNPGTTPGTVTLTYLPTTGLPVTKTISIGAKQRLTINIAGEDASLVSAAVATQVHATVPIVVERAQYWPFTPDQWYEAHNSFGVVGPGLKWGLAEGRVGGTQSYQTYILLANPGATAADVTIQFLREPGKSPQTVTKTFTVAATSRFNVSVGPGTLVPELDTETFGALITATQPIVVERALYSDANGQVWAAGTNATATRLP